MKGLRSGNVFFFLQPEVLSLYSRLTCRAHLAFVTASRTVVFIWTNRVPASRSRSDCVSKGTGQRWPCGSNWLPVEAGRTEDSSQGQ